MHKIAFQLGPWPVHWYGILLALAVITGLWLAGRRGLRDGLPPEAIVDLGPWMLLSAIAGGRALYVISYWREDFAGHPWWKVFLVNQGGLVFYGGLIVGSLVFFFYTGAKKLPRWKMADALAPSIALGHAIGRVGCLMTGCCYGRPTDVPWSIYFPNPHPTDGADVHPVQIYESLLNLALYTALAWLHRRKKFDGQVIATYLICYPVLRAGVETFRGDYPVRYLGGGVTPAQLVSAGILLAGLLLFWKLPRPLPKQA